MVTSYEPLWQPSLSVAARGDDERISRPSSRARRRDGALVAAAIASLWTLNGLSSPLLSPEEAVFLFAPVLVVGILGAALAPHVHVARSLVRPILQMALGSVEVTLVIVAA